MATSLISAEQLRAHIGQLVLLDARPGAATYAAGHLPTAFHADLDRDLSTALAPGHDPAHGGRHPLPSAEAFAALLGAWGISASTDVVVYDAAQGANAAARAWWMLRALGHARVRVLDGGLPQALAIGLSLDTDVPRTAPTAPYPQRSWSGATAAADMVDARRMDPEWSVLDVRSGERYRGEVEPFDPSAGHIPGAKNLPLAENLEPDGRFKSPAALRAQYLKLLGNRDPSRLIVHCGSGVTACHSLLALEIAGLSGAALYVGSWSEWCRSGRQQAKGLG